MLQHVFTGASSLEFLSSLCPSSLSSLAPWSSTLSVLLNEEGGIIDDMIVTKHGDDGQGGQRFYVVTNAGRAEEDVAWITKKMQEWNGTEGKGKGREVKWERLEGYGLVALQGEFRSDDRSNAKLVLNDPLPPVRRSKGCRDATKHDRQGSDDCKIRTSDICQGGWRRMSYRSRRLHRRRWLRGKFACS
jgi:hypothetical protein